MLDEDDKLANKSQDSLRMIFWLYPAEISDVWIKIMKLIPLDVSILLIK